MTTLIALGLIAALLGILYALWSAWLVIRQPMGPAEFQPPYLAIKEGAIAFMKTQYSVISLVGAVIFILLWFTPHFGWPTATGFLVGGFCSGLSGIVGMSVSVRANVRTAAAARHGLPAALKLAYRAGSVTGFLVGGLALAAMCGFYLLLWNLHAEGPLDLRPLTGLGFGASLISIFARLGGGIFTKAADVGADLAGKLEQGIPEDDPRNPAVIADNVGDNVGDCAGMAADVFESYVVTLIAAMLVAAWLYPGDLFAQQYPLALGGVALLAGLLGTQIMHWAKGQPLAMLTAAVIMSVLAAAIGFYFVSVQLIPDNTPYNGTALFYASLIGLAVGIGMVATTNYYTSTHLGPVQRIARASQSGHATNIITGLAVGMESTVVPTLVIAAGIIAAYLLAGIYGIAIATVALLALTPVVISIDAFGPVTDNAGGIVEMAGLADGDQAREVTDILDAVGNTTKALTKVFAIGSAGLASLALFVAYKLAFGTEIKTLNFALDDPYVLAGLFIGSLLPFVFSGLAFDAVGKSASRLVTEVRRQFQAHPDILSGGYKPDYAYIVSMLTRTSIQSMIVPGSLPVLVPLAIAFLWTPFAPKGSGALIMGGVLIGAVGSGLILAFFLSTGGAAWDNAKKYIESGHLGGKGSPAHLAAITGDTVGDPCKDTAGPAINPMRKVLSLMALLLVPFLV
ncbi:MAG TPA: sodium-translocating pyrophosphatase [Gammaproteobacteria bacterium]|nr:sodium-translocating pyrophosphatase [Gammaproteobacteria bacterium]